MITYPVDPLCGGSTVPSDQPLRCRANLTRCVANYCGEMRVAVPLCPQIIDIGVHFDAVSRIEHSVSNQSVPRIVTNLLPVIPSGAVRPSLGITSQFRSDPATGRDAHSEAGTDCFVHIRVTVNRRQSGSEPLPAECLRIVVVLKAVHRHIFLNDAAAGIAKEVVVVSVCSVGPSLICRRCGRRYRFDGSTLVR